ncbi:hypothetical protein Pmani_032622 [Petrolisthes manimaculis]|uniref:SID1-like protein n=1 Tax=Petrolisthes manimaculis TaxID=1843537 RepID=A0AAE1NRD0_9EUCA|nr:hypothetical protein Pmani_032622 [Petrolisthes manimaculis]
MENNKYTSKHFTNYNINRCVCVSRELLITLVKVVKMSAPCNFILMPLLLMIVGVMGNVSIPPQQPTDSFLSEQPKTVKNIIQDQVINSSSMVESDSTEDSQGPTHANMIATKDSQESQQVIVNPLAPLQDMPELRKKEETRNSSAFCLNQNSSEPKNLDCKFFLYNYDITLNSSVPCIFTCTYNLDDKQLWPLRLHINTKYSHPTHNPAFITVQQTADISAWKLPMTFPSLGDDQKFFMMESTLCPPFIKQEGKETVSLRITTGSPINLTVILSKDQHFELVKEVNQTFHVTPMAQWFKLYRWEDKEESVLVTTNSIKGKTVCARLLVQNARCPLSEASLQWGVDPHRYQTFTKQGGMVVHRNNFPDGLFIMVLSLPDDMPCILSDSREFNRTSRSKSVILEVYNHATLYSNWYTFFLTAIFVLCAVGGITAVTLIAINKSLKSNTDEVDREQLLGGSVESAGSQGQFRVEVGAAYMSGSRGPTGMDGGRFRDRENPSTPIHDDLVDIDEEQDMGAGGNRGVSGQLLEAPLGRNTAGSVLSIEDPPQHAGGVNSIQPAYPPPATYGPPASLSPFTETFNPRFVMWWKKVAVFEMKTAEAQVSEVGFQNNLIIMALFAGLPTTELLRSYLRVMLHNGAEDQCFFNSRCMTNFWPFYDFARVFTNIGYLLTGCAFVFIVRRHQKLTRAILDTVSADDSVGVSRHYGLYMSLGYGLIIQSIMSSLYHTCPNSVTIRFDMMFMYVLLTVCVLCMWGLRHGDVTHHIYPTTVAVGVALVMAELREWVSREIFWTTASILYGIILIPNIALMARCGIWSFSPNKLWQVWKGWSPEVMKKLYDVVSQDDRTSTPMQVMRIVSGLVANIILIGCGIGIDPNVYTFILIVCLVNTTLYIFNYVLTKRIGCGEKGQLLAWICLGVSLLLWVPALVSYFIHTSDSETSPSTSRALNSACSIMGVYDFHDLWHLTSAFALFFFFIALLTLDDDLCWEPSRRIHVF